MLINDSPSVEWSKKAYVFNPHARGLVLSEESEENILVNLHGLLGEPDAVQIEIASENIEEEENESGNNIEKLISNNNSTESSGAQDKNFENQIIEKINQNF